MGLTGTVTRRTLTIRLKTGIEDTWDKDNFSKWEFISRILVGFPPNIDAIHVKHSPLFTIIINYKKYSSSNLLSTLF